MTDFLASKRDEIAARLRELAPMVDEYRQLEAAAAALASIDRPPAVRRTRRTAASTPRSAPATRKPRPRGAAAAGARRGRPRGTGTRALQALELVRSQPGITIGEIAAKIGIKQNYLYRVLPALAKDGQVVKRDGGWHATDNGKPADQPTS